MKTKSILRLVRAISALAVSILLLGQSALADALDNWTPGQVVTNPAGFMGFTFSGVAYGNGRYVAVGSYVGDDNGVIETSEDGVKWTMRTLQDYSILDLYDVTYANDTFVAVGWDWFGGRNIYHSTDGISWTPHTTGIANIFRVTFGAGLFVAVGDGVLLQSSSKTNRNIYTSPDGITWTPRNSGAPANNVRPLYDVAYGAGRFVAVDDAGYNYTSTTGVSWFRSYFGASNTISYCNGLFIVPFSPGANFVSPDGLFTSWSVLTNDTGSTFRRVIYKDGLFLALSSSAIFTSTNGTHWVQRNYFSTGFVGDVVFGSRNAVAVGGYLPGSKYQPLTFASDPFVALNLNSGFPPQLTISGLQNRLYQIEYSTSFSGTGWQSLATLSLTNSPLLWTDTTATNSERFYRAALLP